MKSHFKAFGMWVEIEECGGKITSLDFRPAAAFSREALFSDLSREAKLELKLYSAGKLKKFSLPYVCSGTSFQMSVWRAISKIEYAQTISYADLAKVAGYPKAVRAAASACGANALPILIPCHRVIASSGALGGFSCGLQIKKILLSIEGVTF